MTRQFALILLFLLIIPAAGSASDLPYGWSPEFQQRWSRIKDDPLRQDQWQRLDPGYQYFVTNDPAYFPKDLLKSVVGNWCGAAGYKVHADPQTDRLVMRFYGDVDRLLTTFVDGQTVRVHGAPLPKGIESNTAYRIINRSDQMMHSGHRTKQSKYNLLDNSAKFTESGIRPGDLIIDLTTQEYGYVREITNDTKFVISPPWFIQPKAPYEIQQVSFQLASDAGDAAVDIQDEGKNVQFYRADRFFYRPEGCEAHPSGNEVRAQLINRIIRFINFKDRLTEEERDAAANVLGYINGLHLEGDPISNSDSDEMINAWLGLELFKLAITGEDPEEIERINAHPKYQQYKKRVHFMVEDLIGGEGQDTAAFWFEGTMYSPSTVTKLTQQNVYYEWYTGAPLLPVLKQKLPQLGEGAKGWYVPGIRTMFQWGDIQDHYGLKSYRYLDYLATLADLTDDPELWYLYDEVNRNGSHDATSKYSTHSPFYDPYAPRVSEEEWREQGFEIFTDSSRGITFFHTGWMPDDSVLMVASWASSHHDHNPNADHIGLWKAGEWALDWARGYASVHWETHQNNLIPFGALTIQADDVLKDVQYDMDWMYQKGSKSGASGNVVEQTREVFYRRNADGSDVIVVRDVLETPTGKEGASKRSSHAKTHTFDEVPNNILGYESMRGDLPQRMAISDYRHQFNWYVPTGDVQKNDITFSWYANAGGAKYKAGKQKVTLLPLFEPLTTGVWNNHEQATAKPRTYPWVDFGSNQNVHGVLGHSLRIVPQEQWGRNSWVHVIHVRGDDSELKTERTEEGVRIIVGGEKLDIAFDEFSFHLNGKRQISVTEDL